MRTNTKLTAKERKLAEWLSRGAVLEAQIVGSGFDRTLNELMLMGYACWTDTGVKEPSGIPAAAFTLTPAGHAALEKGQA